MKVAELVGIEWTESYRYYNEPGHEEYTKYEVLEKLEDQYMGYIDLYKVRETAQYKDEENAEETIGIWKSDELVEKYLHHLLAEIVYCNFELSENDKQLVREFNNDVFEEKWFEKS